MSAATAPIVSLASAPDAPALHALQGRAYQSEAQRYGNWQIAPLVQSVEAVRAECESSIVLKACIGTRLVGSVRARLDDGVCRIGRLMVEPDLQRRGIGSLLLEAIERSVGPVARFALFTGSDSGENLSLYQKRGYKVVGRRTGEDGVPMTDLSKPGLRGARLDSPVPGIALRLVRANGLVQRFADVGQGPLVLFCHGWPESWYSWRHQLLAIAAAGYRCVAPDMRGYGGTDAPSDVESYTQLHVVGDMVELVHALGEPGAVIVGHDWGAPIAWGAAMMRPDLFRAVAGMSVPWAPPARIDLLTALERAGIRNFYMQYFQAPGVAEAELEADVRTSLRRIYYAAGGEMREPGKGFAVLPEGGGLLANTVEPAALPPWLAEADLDYFATEFARTGFRGGLNWYRNLRRSWALHGPWRGVPIRQPSLFVAGERDGVLRFPASRSQIDAYPRTLPGLRGCHLLADAGHWVQQERADAVNALLLDFLRGL